MGLSPIEKEGHETKMRREVDLSTSAHILVHYRRGLLLALSSSGAFMMKLA